MAQIELFETPACDRGPYSGPVLKSALQKAVRRNRPDLAACCLKSLVLADVRAATRRLPVILIEDTFLHPGFDRMIELKKAASRKAGLTVDQAEWLMRVAAAAAALDVRDAPTRIHPLRGSPVGVLTRLSPSQAALVRALLYRASVGGMADDRAMLRDFAGIWFQRFVSREWSIDRLEAFWSQAWAEAQRFIWESVAPAGPESILPQAIDFHCAPVIGWLLAKPEVHRLVSEMFPRRSPEGVLRAVIWRTRAGLSVKTMIGFDRPLMWERDFPLHWGDGTDEKVKRIGATVAPHLDVYAELVTRIA